MRARPRAHSPSLSSCRVPTACRRVSRSATSSSFARSSNGDGLAFAAAQGGQRYLNPTLVAGEGARVAIDLVNELREPTVAHWHGLAMDTRNDGNGEAPIAPGERFGYAFAIRNRAGLYWYHPHPHGATARQLYRGLFGLFEVEDDDELALRRALDVAPGATQMNLVLQDRRAGDGDRYAPAPEDELLGWYGCLPTSTACCAPSTRSRGAAIGCAFSTPPMRAPSGLRFAATTEARCLSISSAPTAGCSSERVRCNEVLLSPAERVDLARRLRAGQSPGESVVMETPRVCADAGRARALRSSRRTDIAPRRGIACRRRAVRHPAVPGTRRRDPASPPMPGTLSRWPSMPASRGRRASAAARIRQGTLAHQRPRVRYGGHAHRRRTRRQRDLAAAQLPHERAACDAPARLPVPRAWSAKRAPTSSRRSPSTREVGSPPTSASRTRCSCGPGESVRIAIDFRTPFPESQIYLVHCHNLEHEDAGHDAARARGMMARARASCWSAAATAHVEVLRRFALHAGPEVALTLVSPEPSMCYSGMLPGLVAGHYSPRETHIELAPLATRAGARFVVDRVVGARPVHEDRDARARASARRSTSCRSTSGRRPTCAFPGAAALALPVKPVTAFLAAWDAVADGSG